MEGDLPTREARFYELVKFRFSEVKVAGTFVRYGQRNKKGGRKWQTLILSPVWINNIVVDHICVTVTPKLEYKCMNLQPGQVIEYRARLMLYDQCRIKADQKVKGFIVYKNI
jgi:hypothetical protein